MRKSEELHGLRIGIVSAGRVTRTLHLPALQAVPGALVSGAFAECTSQNNQIEIYGRTGAMRVSFYQFDGLENSTTSDIPGNMLARIKNLMQFAKELPRALSTLQQGGEWHQSYVEEWGHFVASVRMGQRVECGLEDGRRVLAIVLAAMESAATGHTISVQGEKQKSSDPSCVSTPKAFP